MKKILLPSLPILLLMLTFSCKPSVMEPPVLAPFEGLDTLCTNDWWNRAPNPIHNVKVERDQVVAFGMYTVMNNVLKLRGWRQIRIAEAEIKNIFRAKLILQSSPLLKHLANPR